MTYLKTKLGERPRVAHVPDTWEHAQAIYLDACDRIPELVDSSKEFYCELTRGRGKAFEMAFAQLARDLLEVGIGCVEGKEGDYLILKVRVRDLRNVALTERSRVEAAFLEMMRSR